MPTCPTCSSAPPAAGGCPRCGRPALPPGAAPAGSVTLVNRPRPAADPTETRGPDTVAGPPPVLPAPMVEPIAPVTVRGPVVGPSKSVLARGLAGGESQAVPAAAPVTLREPPAAGPAPPRPRLVVVRGERVDVAYQVLDGKNYIGRAGDKPVDIDLDGQEPVERTWASRQHAVVTLDRGTLVVEDLNSLNGTFVNRARVHPGQKCALQPGDVVQVGTVQLRVVI